MDDDQNQIELLHTRGMVLQKYHSSQWDSIYKVGSSALCGASVPASTFQSAYKKLAGYHKASLDKSEDWNHLTPDDRADIRSCLRSMREDAKEAGRIDIIDSLETEVL
ncbi:MAG: hypothetical protein ABEN55_21085 [Bradymonadaceae bacterium]